MACLHQVLSEQKQTVSTLVVGKTGSLVVNSSGTDVSFSMDISHGPARRFLQEEHFEWDKSRILVIPCDDESIALNIEKSMHDEYGLFYS